MAKYRPVSPEAAWRDPLVARLDINSRFLELYFLTSPFANVIGCYQLVPAIALAEIGMSSDDFEMAILVLSDNGIIEMHNDFYLVKRWFKHHQWESVLKGNVAKRAVQEVEALPSGLREKWIDACLAAGAPSEFVRTLNKPLESPLQGTCKGLLDYNINSTELNEILPDSTTTISVSPCHLLLQPKMEPYRAFLEQSTISLGQDLAQQIADELTGILDAIEAGKRSPIGSLQRWLLAVIQSAKFGQFVPQWGLSVKHQRELKNKAVAKRVVDLSSTESHRQLLDEEVSRAEKLLVNMEADDFELFVDRVAAMTSMLPARSRILDSIRQRKVPRGPGCVEVLASIKEVKGRANGRSF